MTIITPSTGLIGYWTADNNANDSSPTMDNGSYSGSYVPGISGEAFDLSTAKVYMPDNPAYSFGSNFSVGFWFDADGQSGGTFLGQDDGGGSQSKWFIDYGYHTPGAFEIHLNDPSGNVAFLPSNPVALPQGWNQLTLTKNDSTYTFYLNGVNIGSQTFSGIFPDPTSPLSFGYSEGSLFSGPLQYSGLLDNVVLYDRALAPSEVALLASNTTPPTVTSFTASDHSPTNVSAVSYTVTFSEPVTGVDASQFALVTSGVSGASIASVTPVSGSNGTQYTVTVNTGSGDGTVVLDFTGAGVRDLAGNSLPGGSSPTATTYAAGSRPFSVAIGDLNGDGKPDLAVADESQQHGFGFAGQRRWHLPGPDGLQLSA